ncbi:uncharacterized protein LOC106738177 isoform X1 [Alligator mississippiensis]|uniref:Biogenesis of lysosome-related organelles complex 1 subunit 7 n=2 Tax=Alligator mississippiensis TaxID=8496 RepID=A0A151P4I7_ALLMI|nr:uncharacterized protein LOC106738177 isoform X1 [Alligator mississippiensis]KYO43971.1 hypothetical protein Y1Q_0005870 [Alligator mississippiensis]
MPMTVRGGAWGLLLGICMLLSCHLAQSRAGEEEGSDAASGFVMDHAGLSPEDTRHQPMSPSPCGLTFHAPDPCSSSAKTSSPASPEELDHLKNLLQDTSGRLKGLQRAAGVEASQPGYQDIISKVLPSIRRANLELSESLGRITRELDEHVARADPLHLTEKRQRLRRGLQEMDQMLRVTGRLANQLDDASQDLHGALVQHLDRAVALISHRS